MDGAFPQFLMGAANVALGFGAGWLYQHARTFRSRSIGETAADTGAILDVIDDVESSSYQQRDGWAELRHSLQAGPPGEESTPLQPHINANDCYGRLLKANHNQLAELDPACQVVPRPFMKELADNRNSVTEFTQVLRAAEARSPEGNPDRVLHRLGALEEANNRLRTELEVARQIIADQTAELDLTRTVALEDFLTKLPNRRAFDQSLYELTSAYERYRRPFCLLLIDLDHFKRINDRHGHDAGDAVLKVAARVLRETCRETDHISRFGGEEFTVLAAETKVDGAVNLAERIRRRMECTAVRYGNATIQFTCSVGVAEAKTGCTGERLIRTADELLYAAKSSSRNCVRSLGTSPPTDDVLRDNIPRNGENRPTALPEQRCIIPATVNH